jgi:hypothetical protein
MTSLILPDKIADLIDEYHELENEKPRPHMGVSQLGHHCDRWLWLSFRWAILPNFPGRIKRLFRRGHNEESTIVSDLRNIGIVIKNTGDDQKHIDYGCHVGGSLDGIIESGIPGSFKKKHIAEFKTHSKKSYDDLEKNGVEKSKPMHYVQVQIYMYGAMIDRALYLAVCKDDDRIYTERVKLNKDIAEKYLTRGKNLAMATALPAGISTNPSWYQCKCCNAFKFCHETEKIEVNCRTCKNSTPLANNTWNCDHWNSIIPLDNQYTGCENYVIHPDLVKG